MKNLKHTSGQIIKKILISGTTYDICDEEAHELASTLQSSKQDVITFNTTYSATTNKAATMADITAAISNAIAASY